MADGGEGCVDRGQPQHCYCCFDSDGARVRRRRAKRAGARCRVEREAGLEKEDVRRGSVAVIDDEDE